MKTRLTIFKLIILLCSTFATTAVFGQTTYTWTGTAHEWYTWRRSLHEFAPLLFKD